MKLRSEYNLLEVATDEAMMHERLERALGDAYGPGCRVHDLHVPRVYPRRSGEFLIQYRFQTEHPDRAGRTDRIVYAQQYPPGSDWPPHQKHPESGRTVLWDDLRLRLWLFPSDPHLRHLPALFDTEQFLGLYQSELERAHRELPTGDLQTRTLGYRLGRRFVGQIAWSGSKTGAPDQVVIVKMARPKPALALWTKLQQLERDDFNNSTNHLRTLPRSLFFHPGSGAVFQERASGRTLHELMPSSAFIPGCAAAARILARLSSARLIGLPSWTPADELEQLAWWCRTTGDAFAQLAPHLERLLADLAAASSTITAEKIPESISHRDFYDKQILYDGEQAVLMDCDTLTRADSALDHGNFLAHLMWRRHQHPERAAVIAAGADAFRGETTASGNGFAARRDWWQAASCLRLVCLYAWRPRWRHRVPDFLGSCVLRPASTHPAYGGNR